ncbi:MAG TPA: hypothetical protein VJN65_00900 [Bacteroidota bacterium]|nr:hypothetical protein [Bacteroidota bacterium]
MGAGLSPKKVLDSQFPKFYLAHSMVKRIASILVTLLTVVPLFSEAGVFKPGSPSRVASSGITIRWETSDESSTLRFEVYRREYRSGGMGPAEKIADVSAKGVSSSVYQIEDAGIFKTADRVLEYEIRAVDGQGMVLETAKMTTVFSTGLTSAAKRTWGSIKAMFR